MRGAFACLIVTAWGALASAQEPPSENGLGPYHFGMTLADAEATSARTSWHVEELPDHITRLLSGGPQVVLGGSRLNASLVFGRNGLRAIGLTGSASVRCADAFPAFLGQLEAAFGTFNSAPGPGEGSPTSVAATAGGSEIRILEIDGGLPIFHASRRDGMFIEIAGRSPTDGTEGCSVLVTLSALEPLAGQSASVTYEELDRAQTLAGEIVWLERPTAAMFARAYPPAANDGGQGGMARLDCLFNEDGSLRCLVAYEEPSGAGFGDAALNLARSYRALQNVAGVTALGKRVRIVVRFSVG